MSVWFDKKSKRWRIRIQRERLGFDAKKTLPKGATKSQAEEEHTAIMRKLIDYSHGKQDIALSEVVLKYLSEEVPKLKDPKKQTSHVKAISDSCLGRDLTEIGEVAEEYQKDNEGILTQGTINNRKAVLRRIANLAHKKWKDSNKKPLLKLPVYIEINDPENERRVFLNPETVGLLWRATDHQPTKDAIKLATCSGLRQGNIFDPNIRNYIQGDLIVFPETKNGDPSLFPIFELVQDEVKRLPMPCRPRNMYVHFKRAAEAIGMPDLRFHDLRHTTASLLLSLGYNLKIIQGVLDHKAMISTNRYTHLDIALKREALETLGKHLTGSFCA